MIKELQSECPGAFFPISIGNHYYTKTVLRTIHDQIAKDYKHSILVICDHLRYLSYKIRGIRDSEIEKKLIKEIEEFESKLRNLNFDNQNPKIVKMSEIIKEPGYTSIKDNLLKAIKNNKDLFEFINEHTMYTLESNNDDTNQSSQADQLDYYVSETAMSIFITEHIGYSDEYYKQYDRGLIVKLYEENIPIARSLIENKILKRRFFSLKEIIK